MAHVIFIDSTPTGLNAFRSARRLGHEVTFIHPTKSSSFVSIMSKDPAKLTSQLEHVDRYIEVDTLENEHIFPVLNALMKKNPFDTVISSAETGIMAAAYAAEKWGTPYPSPHDLGNAIFKNRLRNTLKNNRIKSPDFEVLSEEELLQGPKKIELPFVVKPIRGFAKQFSAICRTRSDFDSYVHNLKIDRANSALIDSVVSHEYIVEEYINGTLHSAEVIVRNGKVMFYATTTRYRAHYYDLLELAAVMPSGLAKQTREEMKTYLQAVFNALNIQIGLYHVELLLTESGPILVEINARMMGSVSPIMYQIQTGHDPFEYLIRLHLGEPVNVNDDEFTDAGITLAVAARYGGTVCSSFRPDQLDELLARYEIPHNTLNIYAGREIGRYEGNFSIMGHVIILAKTPDEVSKKGHRFLNEIDALIGLETAKYFA
ncbi:hypothetical protein H045_01900 [Pseudomonas poae RE*1-1-14]|uniref:ATP-grasp domain-containing protein n=1 Tax=Pseudomonas poae TaxID=200451 RepID=UPI0002AF50E5|nr:ATP-grasp domain-containing protein [Pseudomonas poae]AGE24456.1 hypothetical protein H045_01900 [Pseudomonas poae RE*1-1-14]